MNHLPRRAAIYTRVSSEDQLNGHSLEAQARLSSQFCNLREWEIVKVYEERGRSGKTILRPEFQAMLLDAEAGLFDVLVVHKLDRFSRSIVDTHTYIKRLDAQGIAFASATEPFDLTTPMGKAFLGILAIFAELYLDNLSAEIAKGKKQRALKGYWNGQLSWGYTTPKRVQEFILRLNQAFKAGGLPETEYSRQADLLDAALEQAAAKLLTAAIPDPFTALGVQLAYKEYQTGLYSDRDIARLLTEAGYRIAARKGNSLLRKDTVEDILQNRFYLGETSYGRRVKGRQRQWIAGNHEPIIDRDLFDECQAVRKHRSVRYNRGTRKQKSPYLLDMLTCVECGSRLIGYKVRSERKYYDAASRHDHVCRQSPKYLNADDVEHTLADLWRGLKLPQDWHERVLRRFSDETGKPPVKVMSEFSDVEGRLLRLRELYIAGDVSRSEYDRRRNDLEQMRRASQPALTGKGIDLKRAGEMLQNFSDIWMVANTQERKRLFQSLYHAVYIEGGRIKAVEPTEVMWVLLDTVMMVDTGRTGFEPAIRSYPRITA